MQTLFWISQKIETLDGKEFEKGKAEKKRLSAGGRKKSRRQQPPQSPNKAPDALGSVGFVFNDRNRWDLSCDRHATSDRCGDVHLRGAQDIQARSRRLHSGFPDARWFSLGEHRSQWSVFDSQDRFREGEILKQVDLEDKYFGEGLTYHDGLFYQLTWKSGKVFVYDLDLNKVDERSYQGHGWGLTSNGTDLILSEGTATLKFLDPETLEVRRSIRVLRTDGPVGKLNELEYVDYRGGRIYANAYGQDLIYEIEPEHGDVTKVIELFKLWPSRERPSNEAILNGITVNPKNDRWLVTGKLCPTIFELNLFPKEE